MLVLSRKRDERLVITVPPSGRSQTIELLVMEIRGDKVRLGADAPREIAVDRRELWLRKAQSQESRVESRADGSGI